MMPVTGTPLFIDNMITQFLLHTHNEHDYLQLVHIFSTHDVLILIHRYKTYPISPHTVHLISEKLHIHVSDESSLSFTQASIFSS
jgi:hypothetical protein